MIDRKRYADIVYAIIGAAMEVHRVLDCRLPEPIYQEALYLELKDRGIECKREVEIKSYYKEHLLEKKYKMDFVVEDVVVELKSVSHISPDHRAQLCSYLRLTKKPIGLLINFGESSLIGERWAYEDAINECFIVDKQMNPIPGVDSEKLLDNNN